MTIRISPGTRFGRLTTVTPERVGPRQRLGWRCVCDCGGEAHCTSQNLNKGWSRSCGCMRGEARGKQLFKHGRGSSAPGRKDPVYITWASIRYRCRNEKGPDWADYGGRGIKVCERWENDFLAFAEDMGPRPSPRHSIDRINVDGDYCAENCRWADPFEQARNRRNTVMVTREGITRPLAEWCDALGVSYDLVHGRIYSGGWDIERALTTPKRVIRKKAA